MSSLPRFATIDVGTNTVLLLVAERAPSGQFRAVDERMEITRLGRGVDRTRRLAPEAIAETVSVVERFVEAARDQGVEGVAITASSAARDAENGSAFFAKVHEATGLSVEVITGDREAELVFESAHRDFGGTGPLSVVDIGGGSTELIFGDGEGPRFRHSFDVGAVRLTERHLHSDPPTVAEIEALRADLRSEFAAAPQPPEGSRLVGIAGTVTTLCAIELGITSWDGSLVHGKEMSVGDVRRLADRLASMPLEERKRLPGLPEKRADVIVAGAEILAGILETFGFAAVTVSDRGVRWGLLYSRFGAPLGG